MVRKRFNDAMDMWRHDLETSGQTVTVEAFHHHFRTHSAVLTRAELIVEGLKTAPRRLVAG